MTFDECIARIEAYPGKIAKRGIEVMKDEVPVGKTGQLKASVTATASPQLVYIYASTFYAGFVRYGRGVVKPVRKKALWWEDLSHPVGKAKPSKANAFNKRAADTLQSELRSLF